MHHRMPTSKTGWPSLNVVIFPPVLRLVLDDPKQPPFMKVWTCGSSPRSGSRNSWTRIKNVNGASCLSNVWIFFGAIQMISCRARLVTMDETWLYHYDPETKQQQSMEWRHSGSPRPKKFRVQKSNGNVLASIVWDQDGILLIGYLPKGQTINAEYYLSLLVKLKDILKEKRRGEGKSPRGSCSCTTLLRLTGHLQPRRNRPTWASSVLITHPILRIWSRRTTTCSLDWKKQLKGRHFSSDAEVIAAAETWLDGQPSDFFFGWLAKVRAMG